MAHTHPTLVPDCQRIREPVELLQEHTMAIELGSRADDDLAAVRANPDHEPRLPCTTREAAALADGVAGIPTVLTDDLAAGRDQGTRRQRRCARRQTPLEHADIVVVRHEADLNRFRLVGRHQPELPCQGPGLGLGDLAYGCQHAGHDAPIHAPEEVALVLGGVEPAVERSTPGDRVVAGGDVVAVERVRVGQQVPELGERVAAHARNRGTAPAVLAHEVVDHVQREAVLEIEHVVRDAQRVGHVARVRNRVERAAGTVGYLFAVAEELHGGSDHLVALLDQARSGHGAVHAARHRYQHAGGHDAALPSTLASWRSLATTDGITSDTRSTSSAVLSRPRLKRIAPSARSRGTPIASSTWDGSTEPVEHADPLEAATPARTRCISKASLSAPATETFRT